MGQIALGAVVVAAVHFAAVALRLAVPLAPGASLLAFVYWRLVRPDERVAAAHRPVLVVAGGGTCAACTLAFAVGVMTRSWAWMSVPFAMLVASVIVWASSRGSAQHCQLCQQPMIRFAGFVCPRCHDQVCARPSCWNAGYFRCTRCHEREVIALPVHESWWVTRVGRRVVHGECSHCYKEGHEADLRECGQCRWPLCRRCWDYLNGVCPRCKWIVPDLPGDLAAFIAAGRRGSPGEPRAGGPSRRPTAGKGLVRAMRTMPGAR